MLAHLWTEEIRRLQNPVANCERADWEEENLLKTHAHTHTHIHRTHLRGVFYVGTVSSEFMSIPQPSLWHLITFLVVNQVQSQHFFLL